MFWRLSLIFVAYNVACNIMSLVKELSVYTNTHGYVFYFGGADVSELPVILPGILDVISCLHSRPD